MKPKLFKYLALMILIISSIMAGYLIHAAIYIDTQNNLFFIVAIILFVYITGFITALLYASNTQINKEPYQSQTVAPKPNDAQKSKKTEDLSVQLNSLALQIKELSYQHKNTQKEIQSLSRSWKNDIAANKSIPPHEPNQQSVVMIPPNNVDNETYSIVQKISHDLQLHQEAFDKYINKLKGNEFESYILRLLSDYHDELTAWRGDKHLDYNDKNVYPKSNHYPDLEFKHTFDDGQTIIFAIECKWRHRWRADNRVKICDEQWQFKAYADYNSSKLKRAVFLALGIGGTPSEPDELYLIRLYGNRFHPSPLLSHLLKRTELMDELQSNLSSTKIEIAVAKLRFEIDKNFPRIVAG